MATTHTPVVETCVLADRVEIRLSPPVVLLLGPSAGTLIEVRQASHHYVGIFGCRTQGARAVTVWPLAGGQALFHQPVASAVLLSVVHPPDLQYLMGADLMEKGAVEVVAVQSEGVGAIQCALKVNVGFHITLSGTPTQAMALAVVRCDQVAVQMRDLTLLDPRHGQFQAFAFSTWDWSGVFGDSAPLVMRVLAPEDTSPRMWIWSPVLCRPLVWADDSLRCLQGLVAFLRTRIRTPAHIRAILEAACCGKSRPTYRLPALTVVAFLATGMLQTGHSALDSRLMSRALAEADDSRIFASLGGDARLLLTVMRRLQSDPVTEAMSQQRTFCGNGRAPLWAPIDDEARAAQEALELGAGPALHIAWRSQMSVRQPLLAFIQHLLWRCPHLLRQQPLTAQTTFALMTKWAASGERDPWWNSGEGPKVVKALCQLTGHFVNNNASLLPPDALDVSTHAFDFLVAVVQSEDTRLQCGEAAGTALLHMLRTAPGGLRRRETRVSTEPVLDISTVSWGDTYRLPAVRRM